MSTWFRQSLVYGYIATKTEFDKAVGDRWFEDDRLMLGNSPDGIGWVAEDDYYFYGKLLMPGESYGNDTLLAARSGYRRFKTIDPDDFATVCKNLKEMFGEEKSRECDYYILGEYI